MNPVTQRPNKTGISTKTSKFIKEKKKKILKHYTNCTVTSITTGRKGEGGMIIWCGDNVIHKIQSY